MCSSARNITQRSRLHLSASNEILASTVKSNMVAQELPVTGSFDRVQTRVSSPSQTAELVRMAQYSQSTPSSNDEVESPAEVGTFIRFSKLPAELRLKIWEYALPGPTTFDVICSINEGSAKSNDPSIFFETFPSLPGPPEELVLRTALLRTCSESRTEYLTAYPHALPYAVQQNKAQFDRDWHDGLTPTATYKHGRLSFGPSDTLSLSQYAIARISYAHFNTLLSLSYQESWLAEVKRISVKADVLFAYNWPTLFGLFVGVLKFEVLAVDGFRGVSDRAMLERKWGPLGRTLKLTGHGNWNENRKKMPKLILRGFGKGA